VFCASNLARLPSVTTRHRLQVKVRNFGESGSRSARSAAKRSALNGKPGEAKTHDGPAMIRNGIT
jgi:hypothetical protein